MHVHEKRGRAGHRMARARTGGSLLLLLRRRLGLGRGIGSDRGRRGGREHEHQHKSSPAHRLFWCTYFFGRAGHLLCLFGVSAANCCGCPRTNSTAVGLCGCSTSMAPQKTTRAVGFCDCRVCLLCHPPRSSDSSQRLHRTETEPLRCALRAKSRPYVPHARNGGLMINTNTHTHANTGAHVRARKRRWPVLESTTPGID